MSERPRKLFDQVADAIRRKHPAVARPRERFPHAASAMLRVAARRLAKGVLQVGGSSHVPGTAHGF
jgi:hypothetical protein